MSTKTVSQLDNQGYFIGYTVADQSPLEEGVWLLPARAVDTLPPDIPEGFKAKFSNGSFQLEEILVTDEPTEPTPSYTQFELDQMRYQKRAMVQADLLAYMAADNMSRVRSGVWTVSDLTGLMDDPAIKTALSFMSTLSYELATQAIMAATNPLMTEEIKADWVAKLQANFFLVP